MTDYSHWPPAVARVCEALDALIMCLPLPSQKAIDEAQAALAALRAARPDGVGALETLIRKFSEHAESYDALGKQYLNTGGNTEDARRAFAKAVTWSAAAEEARAALNAPAPGWREMEYTLKWIAQEAEKYAYEGHTANHWQKVLAAISREASACLPTPPAQEQQE